MVQADVPAQAPEKESVLALGDYRVLRDAKSVLFTCEEEKRLARRSFGLYRANEVVVSYGTAG